MIPILVLGAGASRRMGGHDKLLFEVHGRTLLRHVVLEAIATGQKVMVTLPSKDTTRRLALSGLDIRIIDVPDAKTGMGASLRAGIKALSPEDDGVLVALADMPDISKDDYLKIINSFRIDADENIYRAATADGQPGNPVLLPRWALENPTAFQGDSGARHLLQKHASRVHLVPLDGNRAITDLDTPQDWDNWQATKI